jgi:hypothetical protein
VDALERRMPQGRRHRHDWLFPGGFRHTRRARGPALQSSRLPCAAGFCVRIAGSTAAAIPGPARVAAIADGPASAVHVWQARNVSMAGRTAPRISVSAMRGLQEARAQVNSVIRRASMAANATWLVCAIAQRNGQVPFAGVACPMGRAAAVLLLFLLLLLLLFLLLLLLLTMRRETGCLLGWGGTTCDEDIRCPEQCSGHEICVDAVCRCNPGWTSPSCACVSGPPCIYGHSNCATSTCVCNQKFTGSCCGCAACEPPCKYGYRCNSDGKCSCDKTICDPPCVGAPCVSGQYV